MTDNKREELALVLKDKGSIIIEFLYEKKETALRKMLSCASSQEAGNVFYQCKVYDSLILELESIKNYDEGKGEK